MRRLVPLLALLGGCVGLYRVDPAPGSEPVDGTFVGIVVTLGSDGNPIATDVPYPAASVAMHVRLADGTTPEVTVGDGVFSFRRATADQAYQLAIEVAGATAVYDATAAHLDLVTRTLGRPDRVPVSGPRLIAYNNLGTLPVGTLAVQLFTTGVWAADLAFEEVPPGFQFDYATAGSFDGPLAELDASKGDRTYAIVLAPVTSGALSYDAVVASRVDPVSTSAAGVRIEGAAHALALDQCVQLDAPRGGEWARISGAYPPDPAVLIADWQVGGLPLPSATLAGFIDSAVLSENTATPTDEAGPIAFAKVIPGYTPVATEGLFPQYLRTAPGALTAVPVSVGTRVYKLLADPATCTDPVALGGTIGIVGDTVLAGVTLTGDVASLPIDRSAPVPLSWSIALGGADVYTVVLFEVSLDAIGKTVLAYRYAIITTARATAIDPALLEAGHTYMLSTTAVIGAPGAREGDFRTLGFPREESTQVTPIFTIGAP